MTDFTKLRLYEISISTLSNNEENLESCKSMILYDLKSTKPEPNKAICDNDELDINQTKNKSDTNPFSEQLKNKNKLVEKDDYKMTSEYFVDFLASSSSS